ncbi:hypothetical protein MKX03_031717 [Papaver bracteatum]|nr:hypothetical protein MKX03_031717 [Papaver bracteatum]
MESVFLNTVQGPEDPTFVVTAAFEKDSSPTKLNLAVRSYRNEEGNPIVLKLVRKAEQMHPYLYIFSKNDFRCLYTYFGEHQPSYSTKRVTTVQCVAGTGALSLLYLVCQRSIYIPRPTWGNHPSIFSNAGLSLQHYRYYEPTTHGLDFEGLLEDLNCASTGSVVLRHACAHNPTGVDPTLEQWEQIRQLVRSKGLLPFFDAAYQGFASGNLDVDAKPVRMFVADGGECLAAQSYAKNMALYSERVGSLNIVCKSADVVGKVESQLKLVMRPMYSNPPIHGPSLVLIILKDGDLYNQWITELKEMTDRIIKMRRQLFDALTTRGTPGDWTHIVEQIGLFSYAGLTTEQVAFMQKEYNIYMTSDGRISILGLSSKTVPHLVDAIHAAVTC